MADDEIQRRPLPPASPTLQFAEWTQAIVTAIRTILPDTTAKRSRQRVIISRGSLDVEIVQNGSVWVVKCLQTGFGSLMIERHDAFTAHNAAETILWHFDATTVHKARNKAR